MLYGCPCTVVSRNPVFLSGGLGLDADELVAQDAAVSALQSQLRMAEDNLSMLKGQRFTGGKGVRMRTQGCTITWTGSEVLQNKEKKCTYKYYRRGQSASRRTHKSRPPGNARKALLNARDHVDDIKKRLKKAESTAMQRLTQNIPYKGHVIRPSKEGNRILYTVYKDGVKDSDPFKKMEEAKAWIDKKSPMNSRKRLISGKRIGSRTKRSLCLHRLQRRRRRPLPLHPRRNPTCP